MAMATGFLLQVAILILTFAICMAIYIFPKQALTKLRSRTRTTAQANRHFVHGAELLARARSNRTRSTSVSLAKNAAAEADKALSLNPRDAAAHILKALALDVMGHKSSALKYLDSALKPPAVKSLSDRERGDALYKRAELQMALNRRRRVDSAMTDLVEAVSLSSENEKAVCLLGECYEMKGMREEARKAFKEALRIEPGLVVAHKGLERLGPLRH